MKAFAALAFSLAVCSHAFAQAYPAKPIHIVQPYQAGGPAEGLARMVGNKMAARLGQAVLIETKLGAGGTIATGYVAKAPADGYTVLLAHVGPIALSPATQKDLPYDVLRDFEPVCQLVATPLLLVVRNDIPARTVKEFIDYAKANPGQLTYGSIGVGSTSHLAGAMLDSMTGTKTLHVPFKGSAQTLVEMIGGRISYSFIGVSGSIQQARAGQIRALAVTTQKRSSNLPDIPSVAETVPGFELNSWYGLMVPTGTPKAVVMKLQQEAVLAVKAPDVLEWMKVNGLDPQGSTPEEFGALVRSETDKWAKTIKAVNFSLN
ncbi:MAG: tripartite tricarboxylate transporter substrate binding protein [Betaproteobacteria bacterium]|nr:tripartite tricarboxylate transporter substrate binding protein [Betaproteobacteria bacterium]